MADGGRGFLRRIYRMVTGGCLHRYLITPGPEGPHPTRNGTDIRWGINVGLLKVVGGSTLYLQSRCPDSSDKVER